MNNIQTQQLELGPILSITAMMVVMGAVLGMMREPRNPGNPTNMTDDVVARSGLTPYVPHLIPLVREEEEKAARKKHPVSVRSKSVGPYEVVATRWKASCGVKLYENLPGWRRRLRASKTVDTVGECDALFERTVDAIKQIRFEYKTALGR